MKGEGFNFCLTLKGGGLIVLCLTCKHFNECVKKVVFINNSYLGISIMSSSGGAVFFTWSNGVISSTHVKVRL